jgi:hypothetical protein
MVVILRERSKIRVILRERSDRRISGTGIPPDRQSRPPEILRPFRGLRMTKKKRVIARSVSDEAIQGEYVMNKPWIASPASDDAGSQ